MPPTVASATPIPHPPAPPGAAGPAPKAGLSPPGGGSAPGVCGAQVPAALWLHTPGDAGDAPRLAGTEERLRVPLQTQMEAHCPCRPLVLLFSLRGARLVWGWGPFCLHTPALCSLPRPPTILARQPPGLCRHQRPLCPLPSHRPWRGFPWEKGEAGRLSSMRLLCAEVSSPWCLVRGVHGHLSRRRVTRGWRTGVKEKKTPLDQPGGGQSARERGEAQRTGCLCGQVGGGSQDHDHAQSAAPGLPDWPLC